MSASASPALGAPCPHIDEQPVFGARVVLPSPGRTAVLVFVRQLSSVAARSMLTALQDHVRAAEAQGTLLVAVTPSSLELARDHVPRHHLLFPVLADPDRELHERFAVGRDRWLVGTLGHALRGRTPRGSELLRHGRGLEPPSRVRPAWFVVGSDGRLALAERPRSVGARPELDELLGIAARA